MVVEKDDNRYMFFCPELEGCQTQKDSLDEVMKNIKEAIELYLQTLLEDEKQDYFSHEIFTKFNCLNYLV